MNQYSNGHFGMLPKDSGNGLERMRREKVYEGRMTHDRSQRQEGPVLKETGLVGGKGGWYQRDRNEKVGEVALRI